MKKGYHKMPDGKLMKDSDMKSDYKHGATKKKPAVKMNKGGYCGASNPASKPMKKAK